MGRETRSPHLVLRLGHCQLGCWAQGSIRITPSGCSHSQKCPFPFIPTFRRQSVGEGGGGVHPSVMQPLSPGSQTWQGLFWERCPTMVCGRAASVAPQVLSVPLVLLCQTWHCLQMASTQPGSPAQSWPCPTEVPVCPNQNVHS